MTEKYAGSTHKNCVSSAGSLLPCCEKAFRKNFKRNHLSFSLCSLNYGLCPMNSFDLECSYDNQRRQKNRYSRILFRMDEFFQFTLNPYGGDLEAYLPSLSARIDTFQTLSRYLGKERVLWRYDPIIVNGKYTIGWHIEEFRRF